MMNYKDVAVRAVKTFAQAFLGALAVSVSGIVDMDTAKAALLAAISAGVAAAWNAALEYKKGQ